MAISTIFAAWSVPSSLKMSGALPFVGVKVVEERDHYLARSSRQIQFRVQ